MATTILITFLLAGIAYGHPDDDAYYGFGPNMVYEYVTPLPLPSLPYIPGMPPLPPPPPLLVLRPSKFPKIPSPQYPSFPQFPEYPRFPTVDEIVTETPQPGGSYEAVAINSQSNVKRTENGKLVRNGGSTAIFNDNGNITMETFGESPPEIIVYSHVSPFPDFPTKFNYFMPPPPPPPVFQPFPNFEPFRPVNPYVFPDINSDTMKNFVPAEGQHYVGVSSSSQSFSSNVNGVKTSGGKVSSLTNIDGNVDEQKLAFHKNDPPKP